MKFYVVAGKGYEIIRHPPLDFLKACVHLIAKKIIIA